MVADPLYWPEDRKEDYDSPAEDYLGTACCSIHQNKIVVNSAVIGEVNVWFVGRASRECKCCRKVKLKCEFAPDQGSLCRRCHALGQIDYESYHDKIVDKYYVGEVDGWEPDVFIQPLDGYQEPELHGTKRSASRAVQYERASAAYACLGEL